MLPQISYEVIPSQGRGTGFGCGSLPSAVKTAGLVIGDECMFDFPPLRDDTLAMQGNKATTANKLTTPKTERHFVLDMYSSFEKLGRGNMGS